MECLQNRQARFDKNITEIVNWEIADLNNNSKKKDGKSLCHRIMSLKPHDNPGLLLFHLVDRA